MQTAQKMWRAVSNPRLQRLFARHEQLWNRCDRQEAFDSLARMDNALGRAAALETYLRQVQDHVGLVEKQLDRNLRELEQISQLLEQEADTNKVQTRITHNSDALGLLIEKLDNDYPKIKSYD